MARRLFEGSDVGRPEAGGETVKVRSDARPRDRSRAARRLRSALACVIGDIDLVSPLGLAGIRCAVVVPPGDPARYSRFTGVALDWVDPWHQPEQLVETLVSFASEQAERPVLFYENDDSLLLVSRNRDRLSEVFRFVVPDHALVESLVDKSRFLDLAASLGLPVPRTQLLTPSDGSAPVDVELRYPLVVKPLTRRTEHWAPISGSAKAMHVETPEEQRALWPALADVGQPVLAQEAVPGPETSIESYHAYVDAGGAIVAEFTGRKVRTYPAVYGYSTALVITRSAEVTDLGRRLVDQTGLRGVLKCDFKRGPKGDLSLLEINPRFTLWHHPGARAGVNIPALVYDDLVGLPRGHVVEARPGTRWCFHLHDARAAKEGQLGLARWLLWVARCDVKSTLSWRDPLPFVRGVVLRRLVRACSATRARLLGLVRSGASTRPAAG